MASAAVIAGVHRYGVPLGSVRQSTVIDGTTPAVTFQEITTEAADVLTTEAGVELTTES